MTGLIHVIASIAMMFVMHDACKYANGWLSKRAFVFLLFIHALILIVVITALSPQASVRYLQPISMLTLFEHRHLHWLASQESKAGRDVVRFMIRPR
jgi:hypothetical protein